MAEINVMGSSINSSLYQLLVAEDLVPGDEPSYELTKIIYAFHPLGGKIVDAPIALAMSQQRKISIPNSPEEKVREAFERKWREVRLYQIAPISTNLILGYVGQHVLGMPRSY